MSMSIRESVPRGMWMWDVCMRGVSIGCRIGYISVISRGNLEEEDDERVCELGKISIC